MRVIAGKYKSRRLIAPQGTQTRPTSDPLRETLVSVVAAGVEDAVWLALFGGSGAVGIEALRRGASSVYFVDSSRDAASVIRKNLHSLKIEEGTQVMEREAIGALRVLEAEQIS